MRSVTVNLRYVCGIAVIYQDLDSANTPKETENRSITLPESEQTVSTMLQEIYRVYNPTTGSIFTNFALRRALEKDRVVSDLLGLFVASDKVSFNATLHITWLTTCTVQS